MRENRLRWFGHVQHMPTSAPIRKSDMIIVNGAMIEEGLNELGWRQLRKIC